MASTYLSKSSYGTPTNNKIFTFSCWIKRNGLGDERIFDFWQGGASPFSYGNGLFFTGSDQLGLGSGDSGNGRIITNRVFRDTSAWYHIVAVQDTTNSTASDRLKLYVNGERETSFSASVDAVLNAEYQAFRSDVGGIGTYYDKSTSSLFFDGSMSHVHFIDGTAYDASAFGSTDATTGEWKINTSPSVTYGTNGFFILKDGNSVTDQSGNSNNFTVGSGTLTKTEDCPSNVFATFNPLIKVWASTTTLSNGNTTVTNSDSSDGSPPTTIGATSGKYYWEMKKENTPDVFIGVCGDGFVSDNLTNNYSGVTSNATTGLLVYNSSGDKVVNGSTSSSFFTSYGAGDIIGIAIDLDATTRTVTFYKNGVVDSQGAQNLPTNMQSGAVFGVAIVDDSATVSANFGNGYFGTTAVASAGTNASGIGIFEYDVPTGYTALSTKGLNL